MKTIKTRFEDVPKTFEALCALHPPRPIHDAMDLANTTEIAALFAGREGTMTPDQEDFFALLCGLIEDYERQNLPPFEPRKGIELLKELLAQHGMNGADLSRLLGTDRTLGNKILRSERSLTLAHVRTLAQHFSVNPGVFCQ
ncbi:MAG TPA: helix-turn-helix domain-containing protein [Chthoniobacterales bacterium]